MSEFGSVRSHLAQPEKAKRLIELDHSLFENAAAEWVWNDDPGQARTGRLNRWDDEKGDWVGLCDFKNNYQARRWLGTKANELEGPKGLVTAVVVRAVSDYIRGGSVGIEAGKFLASDDCRGIVEGCGGKYKWPCANIESLKKKQ